MSILLEQLKPGADQSLTIGVFQDNLEKSTWHYHTHYEISFITEGSGKRIVADSIEEFSPGDLIFLGLKLPHVWIPEKKKPANERALESVYLQFNTSLLSAEILNLPEFANVKNALRLSERGVKVGGATLDEVSGLMLKLPYFDKFDRILTFYRILDRIGSSNSVSLLASEGYMIRKFRSSNERISRIHEFLMSNFLERVDLNKIADLVHMAPGSVCRFFKSQMGLTIFEYLNKIKVDYACSLLLSKDLTIVTVGYDCGFNNLSHFNKQFRKITGKTPSEYRKLFMTI
jgi:AraC-like DNA-binding protein